MRKSTGLLLNLLVCVAILSCGKESVKPDEVNLESYFNLQPGKYNIYQLDSIVKATFNDTAFTEHSYQAKDLVDTIITDNLGRKSWRILRYLRPLNSNDDNAWTSSDTYFITATRENVEVVENNLRYLKLILPLNENTFWKGNTHINTTPGGPLDYLDAWEYNYTNIDGPFTPLESSYDSTITVLEADQGAGFLDDNTPLNVDQNGYRIYSEEVYAKNIGLIYKYLNFWTFDARTTDVNGNPSLPRPFGSRNGGGIRLRLISHN
jgi:hypothetical protein